MKAASRDRYEFTWGTPRYGLVLGTYLAHRKVTDAEPGDIFLRAAVSPEDASDGLPVEEVTQLLEQWFRSGRVDEPFIGETGERLKAERLKAERLTEEWDLKTKPYPVNRSYSPLSEETGLFRTFASIEPSPEGILTFARQYGNLMNRTCPILAWWEEVLAMRRALQVWDLLWDNNVAELHRHFILRTVYGRMSKRLKVRNFILTSEHRYLFFDSHPEMAAGKHPQFPDRRVQEPISLSFFPQEQWENLIKNCDAAEVARAYLQQVINDRFAKYVGSILLWTGPKTLRRILRPKNLLGALWLQFEASITGNKEYGHCLAPGCGKPFERSPGAARSDKEYCGDKCRVRAFQARVKRAQEMWAEGRSIREIAKELRVEEGSVKKWVKKQMKGEAARGQRREENG